MKTLDKSRSFGTICGSPPISGAMFAQDGLLFDSNGNLCGGQNVKEHEEEIAPKDEIKQEGPVEEKVNEPDRPAEDTLEGQIDQMNAAGESLRAISRKLGVHHMKVKSVIANLQADKSVERF